MPDTRPGIKFVDGVCVACTHYEQSKNTDWTGRMNEFKQLCDKHRNSKGDDYDCAIAISGGKDSHCQVHYMKNIMN